MIWSKSRFQHSFELLPRVIKEVAPLLLPLSFLLWGMEFYVAYLNKARFEDPYNSSMALMIVVVLGGMILQTLMAVVGILYVARSTQRQSKNGHGEHPMVFLKKHFHQSLIENIRGFISVGIYTLFLIIPGIVRWVQLIFVTLVAAFDPAYQEGKKDALKESSRITRGFWLGLLTLLFVQMMIPWSLEELGKSDGIMGWGSVPLYLLSWVIGLYFSIYFSLTFFACWSFKAEKA